MEKVLIIFRGQNIRYRKAEHAGMGTAFLRSDGIPKYINPLLAIPNWKKSLFEDLSSNGIKYDIAFVTYPSEVLDPLIKELNPRYVLTSGYNDQLSCMRKVTDMMEYLVNEYDRFIILRFDFEYRIKLTMWPKWNEKGIILVNRDVTWDDSKLYADILFVVDSASIKDWRNSIDSMISYPHDIGKYLHNNNLNFHLMYDGYYNMVDHPLHSYVVLEETPDLDNPIEAIKIK